MTMTQMAFQAQASYYSQPDGPQPAKRKQGLTMAVFGHQKQGKSSFGDSGPRPVLMLDVEASGTWTPSAKIYWNPQRETVPTWPVDPRAESPDGLWDTCIVIIHDYRDLDALHKILMTGQHPFNSISMDSVTEIQQRIMRAIAKSAARKLEWDDWGVILREINALIRAYRDLLTHPTNQVWAVTYIMGTKHDDKVGKWRPLLQGASQDYVPYVPDLTGWLEAQADGSRHLWIGPSQFHETGNRLWGRLPDDMQLGYPGVVPGWTAETMVQQVLATK
jgi:hypothetical protein